MTNNISERVSKLNNFAYSLLTHSDVVQQNWALLFPNYQPGQTEISDERLTYSEFASRVGVVQSKFGQLGFKPKDRVVVMFAPSVELYVLLTALFASNIAAVFIDPGFSLRRIAHCIQEAHATAVIGVKKVGILRVLFSGLRRIPQNRE